MDDPEPLVEMTVASPDGEPVTLVAQWGVGLPGTAFTVLSPTTVRWFRVRLVYLAWIPVLAALTVASVLAGLLLGGGEHLAVFVLPVGLLHLLGSGAVVLAAQHELVLHEDELRLHRFRHSQGLSYADIVAIDQTATTWLGIPFSQVTVQTDNGSFELATLRMAPGDRLGLLQIECLLAQIRHRAGIGPTPGIQRI